MKVKFRNTRVGQRGLIETVQKTVCGLPVRNLPAHTASCGEVSVSEEGSAQVWAL